MKMKRNDNRGASLVVVIITIAFVGILVSMIMYMSLMNYRIKIADNKNKVSFYHAENALDEIKAGLQGEVSKAVGAAYMNVMQKYGEYSDEERSKDFQWQYMNALRNALKTDGNDSLFKVSTLSGYLKETAWDDATGTGATVTALSGTEGTLVARVDGIVLKDITITYVSSDGNMSCINTDIKLAIPDISFNESYKTPDILSYCIIANNSLVFTNGNPVLNGSVYGGSDGIKVGSSAPGMASTTANLNIQNADLVITDNLVSVQNGSELTVNENSNLWAQGVEVDSSTVYLNGSAYIKDDLTINGERSEVTVSNTYFGYGYGYGAKDSANNSAILINGLKTTLDMSNVRKLYLAGHSYIKTAGTVSGTTFTNANNITMGESLAIKSDQIAYLVPAECLWVKDGVSLSNMNPVIYNNISSYQTAGATEYDLSVISKTMGVPLDSYATGVERVYSNKFGDIYVYYYLTFDTETQANYFFKAYYNADKERMNRYISKYVTELKMPIDTMMRVNLAGHVFDKVDGEFVLKDSTVLTDNAAELELESNEYTNNFTNLSTALTFTNPTPEQVSEKSVNGIFYNIIKKDELDKLLLNVGDKQVLYDATNTHGVVAIRNAAGEANAYKLSADSGVDFTKIRIIIATGDVVVDRNFEGIIISGGTITVRDCHLNSHATGVNEAMQIETTLHDGVGGTTQSLVVNLFVGGSGSLNPVSGPTGGNAVDTADLIVYENWSKE